MTNLYFDGMSEVLYFIFAALRPAFSSFAAVDAELGIQGDHFLELHFFLQNGLLIFGAFGSAPAPMLLIVIGGLLVLIQLILLFEVVSPIALLLLTDLPPKIILLRILAFLVFLLVVIFLFPDELLNLMVDLLVLSFGDNNPIVLFLAPDLNFRLVGNVENIDFAVDLKDNMECIG